MSSKAVITLEFILYLGFVLGIGLYFARKKLTQAEFHLGGKTVPGWALALSERATGESAWCLLGLTGFAYSAGLSSIWIALGCVSGIVISWLWLAVGFQRERDRFNTLTFPDYLAARYAEQGKFIRWFASLIIVFFFLLYVAAQFSGGGKTLNVTFGINTQVGILISAIIVIAYSIAGGFLSVVWTDVVQAVLMFITLVVTPIVALMAVARGGLSITTALKSAGSGMDSFTGTAAGFAIGLLIINNFSWFFGYLGGQPQLNARWMAMKDEKSVKQGAWIAIGWTILAYSGAIIIGLCGLTLYGPAAVDNSEQILPFMLMKLMPPWIAGILLAGAIAAMMSTADSQLLVATSSISEDIIHKAMKQDVNDNKLVLISRITILVTGGLALLIAFLSKSLIYTLVHFAWAGIGCTFSPVVILSFFWKRFNGKGAIAAMMSGFIITLIWMIPGLDKAISSTFITFWISMAAAVGVTLLTSQKASAVSA